ncbi:hypothetical protein QQS21_010280 [Conoideocrella luteorostrata]|uniref:Clavaminate synthase-like protein n=1 Tax=Conoideocrella luteorostrata TaxID=1105319 RepID=A0AAJ0CI15_9HYPO|nr:hypothetical protein QQS21_010280 [Conoideocrella luteorostrata]
MMQSVRNFAVAGVIPRGRGKHSGQRLIFSRQPTLLSQQPRFRTGNSPAEKRTLTNETTSLTEGNRDLRLRSSSHTNSATTAASARKQYKKPSMVQIPIQGQAVDFSAVLLRDACSCPSCVHESTNQRLFSTADIPANIAPRVVETCGASDSIRITWENDVPGFRHDHTTTLKLADLRVTMQSGSAPGSHSDNFSSPVLWSRDAPSLPDFDYEEYMKDDGTLFSLVRQLRTQGLAFVTNVPELEESLAAIAMRIGPIKDTFYGRTWDGMYASLLFLFNASLIPKAVRTVPAAINAAYTTHELGFHTDLLYFEQPPHVQLLHCMRSASSGGATVFADAYKAAVDLFHTDPEAFNTLTTVPVNYHYNHPKFNIYHTTKTVIDLQPLRVGESVHSTLQSYIEAMRRIDGERSAMIGWEEALLVNCLDKINWGPPFLAPFSKSEDSSARHSQPVLSALNEKVDRWHDAASKFNALLQRSEYLYERRMKPGECVLFDNTRTLHSRRAFNMADVGKPRWLRGTYVDKDPYFSKLRVLQHRFR